MWPAGGGASRRRLFGAAPGAVGSAGPTWFPHWLQKGICSYIRYSFCDGSGNPKSDLFWKIRHLVLGRRRLAEVACGGAQSTYAPDDVRAFSWSRRAALLPAAKNLEVYSIDVEGGQATLVVSPSGESMLVDTGWGGHNKRDAERIAAAAKAAGVKKIDYLVITHYHTDHVGGIGATGRETADPQFRGSRARAWRTTRRRRCCSTSTRRFARRGRTSR